MKGSPFKLKSPLLNDGAIKDISTLGFSNKPSENLQGGEIGALGGLKTSIYAAGNFLSEKLAAPSKYPENFNKPTINNEKIESLKLKHSEKTPVIDEDLGPKSKEGRAERKEFRQERRAERKNKKEIRKTTKGKGRNFRSAEEGAGMTSKGVSEYKKKNPGSNLQTAVTGDVKPGSKAAKRRKSFCARSKGWTGERGKAARARWKC